MADKKDPPSGFSIPIPTPTPRDTRLLNPKEYEKELLENLKQQEQKVRDAYFYLVCFYSDKRRWDLGLPYLEHLLDITTEPEEKSHYVFSMGQLMEQAGDFERAVDFYKQALTMEPADDRTWYLIHNNLGYSLNKLGRYAEGERYCRQAIQIDYHQYNAYKNLGISLDGQGNYAEAAKNFIESTRANAGDPRALQHLEDLLKRQPGLLKDNPALLPELKKCQQASRFAKEMIQRYIDDFENSHG